MSDGELRASSLFDTVGKALGSLAGLAIFVYVVGGLTVLARLRRVDLPPEVVIPKIPRERLALIGLAQLLWTLVLGGLIAASRSGYFPTVNRGRRRGVGQQGSGVTTNGSGSQPCSWWSPSSSSHP